MASKTETLDLLNALEKRFDLWKELENLDASKEISNHELTQFIGLLGQQITQCQFMLESITGGKK